MTTGKELVVITNGEELNQLVKDIRVPGPLAFRLLEPIVCNDGFSFSLQASRFHYCTPRNDEGPYTAFEIGFPSSLLPPEFEDYSDGPDVYAYVPKDMVVQLIKDHGGFSCTIAIQ